MSDPLAPDHPNDALAPRQDVLHPQMSPQLHDALAAVRSRGAYYGGAPIAPGPPLSAPAAAATGGFPGGRSAQQIMQAVQNQIHGSGVGPMRPISGTGVRAGTGPKNLRPDPANQNIARGYGPRVEISERLPVLNKIVLNRDFVPELINGRMYFRSLTPRENEVMARVGWARAPGVTAEEETSSDPLTLRRAWERNIRHWLELANPE